MVALGKGWLTVTGRKANLASSAFVSGTLIQGFIELVDVSSKPELWHGTLLLYGAPTFSMLLTTVIGTVLPKVENMLLVFHILGFFGVLVALLYLGPHGNAYQVFTTSIKDGVGAPRRCLFSLVLLAMLLLSYVSHQSIESKTILECAFRGRFSESR